ncbi:uncharacterized protein [Temnothorax nylanderi]|uniref:uncharacterized protein n=1 Tax=Temnothorax nylanderi TaxID=102681 RepID=UPI003A848859
MRKGWYKNIGELVLPPNTVNAKICSMHFTPESFVQPKRKRAAAEKISKRRSLLPSAVPTLYLLPLNEQASRKEDNMKVKKREFNLVCPSTSTNTPIRSSTPGPSPAGVTEHLQDLDLLMTDSTNCHETLTSVSTTNRCQEPTNSDNNVQEVSYELLRSDSSPTRSKKKNVVIRSKTKVHEAEQGSPPLKRQCRYMDENIISNVPGNTASKEEDPHKTITWLKADLKHYRSLYEFHASSVEKCMQELNSLEMKNKSLTLQLAERETILAENIQLKTSIAELNKQLEAAKREKEAALTVRVSEKMKTVLNPYLTKGQIRCILENKKCIRWSVDDYASAILFRSISPKAYRYFHLKLRFPLPSLSSLRRWALKKFDIREGFLMDVLAMMKNKAVDLNNMEKISVLTFDEMALSDKVCFDSKLEKLVGPCSKVQVIMIRGLFGNWKQPIYYKFDQIMRKDILMTALTLLYTSGYEVVACTSDMRNKGVWEELEITPEKHYFQHPMIPDGKVFVFADVPHLLKLLRNWFVNAGFTLHNCTSKFTVKVYEEIVKMGNGGDLRVAHKITQPLLDARQNLRQSVHLAAKLWSHTAAKAIKWVGNQKLLSEDEYMKYSDFVMAVNNWFDVHNSHPGVKGYGVDLRNQEQALTLMTLHTENMRVGCRTSLMPFQKGILISNASLRALYDYLSMKFPQDFQYIITRRLQQDILENFFSYIRGMGAINDSPSGYDFQYRLRWYILGKHSQALFTMNRNTEEDLNASCMSSSTADTSLTTRETKSRSVQSTGKSLTPSSVIRLHAPNFTDGNVVENTSKYDDNNLQEEIILTEELFNNIINITSEDILDDSARDKGDNCTEDNFDVTEQAVEIEIIKTATNYGNSCKIASTHCHTKRRNRTAVPTART